MCAVAEEKPLTATYATFKLEASSEPTALHDVSHNDTCTDIDTDTDVDADIDIDTDTDIDD